MIQREREVIGMIEEMFLEAMRGKKYGTFSVSLSMHEGLPLKITKTDETTLKRVSSKSVKVVK